MVNRKIQLALLIGIILILQSGCTISKDKIVPTGAVTINANTNEKVIDIIIKTNEKYKNMEDFKASKVINKNNIVKKEVIMIKGDKYKINRESFEEEDGWYVKNKITEISNGDEVWIAKTFEPSTITEVEENLENQLISDPNHPIYIKLGMIYYGLGKVEEAEEMFKKAIKLNPDIPNGLFELGWVYHNQGKTEEAEEMFQSAEMLIGPNPSNYVLSASGSFIRAQDALKEIKKIDPDFHGQNNNVREMDVNDSERKMEAAKEIFKYALELIPNNEEYYMELSRIYKNQGDIKMAEEMIKKAADINPNGWLTYFSIGSFPVPYSNIKKAEEMLEKAISLKPDDKELYEKLGWAYLNQWKVNDAEEMFRKSIIKELPTYEVKERNRYDEIQYIKDILDFNQYTFILKQNRNFYFLEGKKMKDTALWSKIKAEINKDELSVTKLEFYKEADGKEKLVKSIIYENISFNNNFEEKEFSFIEE